MKVFDRYTPTGRSIEIRTEQNFMQRPGSNEMSFQGLQFMQLLADKYPAGSVLTITVQPYIEIEMSRKVVGYWYAEIVTKFREGLYELGSCFNDAKTEDFILTQMDNGTIVSNDLLKKFASSIKVDRLSGKIHEVVPVVSAMSSQQLYRLFEPIIAYGIENLHINIANPESYLE